MSLRHKRSARTLMSSVFNCTYCFPEKLLREKNVALLQARRNWDAERGSSYSFTCNITSVPISLSSNCATLSMILSALRDASGRTFSPHIKSVLATLVCKQHSWVDRGLSDSLKRVLCTKQWNYSACHSATTLSLVTAPTTGSNTNWESPRIYLSMTSWWAAGCKSIPFNQASAQNSCL